MKSAIKPFAICFRSKELELGGGVAALQGVSIQAVVTEFLICYADLIFSDKMPSYSSPELRRKLWDFLLDINLVVNLWK